MNVANDNLLQHLEELLGKEHVVSDRVKLSFYAEDQSPHPAIHQGVPEVARL